MEGGKGAGDGTEAEALRGVGMRCLGKTGSAQSGLREQADIQYLPFRQGYRAED